MNAQKNFAGILTAAMVASGCVVEVQFEPIGGDVIVAGSWTINGVAADATTCDAAGISTVQLFVCDAVDGNCYSSSQFTAPCSQGSFNSGPLLVPGTYALQWAAYDSAGLEVNRSDWNTVTAASGDTIDTSADFAVAVPSEVTLSASWSINGVAADTASCTNAGVQTVRFTAFEDAAGTTAFRSWDIPCANGLIDSRTNASDPTLPAGTFYTYWEALDATGEVLATFGGPDLLDTSASTHANLLDPDFTIVLVNTLDVTLLYESDVDGSFGDCTASNVDGAFNYVLRSSGGATIAMDFGGTCANGLTFEDIASDTYVLEVDADGTRSAGTVKWGATCSGLVVEAGLEEYDCQLTLM